MATCGQTLVHTPSHTRTHTHAHALTFTHIHTHARTHAHTHVCIQAYTRTLKQTVTCVQFSSPYNTVPAYWADSELLASLLLSAVAEQSAWRGVRLIPARGGACEALFAGWWGGLAGHTTLGACKRGDPLPPDQTPVGVTATMYCLRSR